MNLAINDAAELNISWEQFKIQNEVTKRKYKTTKLVGDLILERQELLLGHMLRLDTSNFMQHVTCNEQLRRPYQLYKRTGAPRTNWFDDNMNRVYAKISNTNDLFDFENPTRVEMMKQAANDRKCYNSPSSSRSTTESSERHIVSVQKGTISFLCIDNLLLSTIFWLSAPYSCGFAHRHI